jgi:hypothetical protein
MAHDAALGDGVVAPLDAIVGHLDVAYELRGAFVSAPMCVALLIWIQDTWQPFVQQIAIARDEWSYSLLTRDESPGPPPFALARGAGPPSLQEQQAFRRWLRRAQQAGKRESVRREHARRRRNELLARVKVIERTCTAAAADLRTLADQVERLSRDRSK